jgi:hypothetical protein
MTDQQYAAWLPRPIPSRVRMLPVDSAGKPIPYFVQRDEFGKPVASTVDGARLIQCLRYHRCYFCGDLMGRTVAYHARVSTGVSRIVPEPAMHVDCAEWAACAFRPVIAEPVLVWITSDGFQVLRMDERGALLRNRFAILSKRSRALASDTSFCSERARRPVDRARRPGSPGRSFD